VLGIWPSVRRSPAERKISKISKRPCETWAQADPGDEHGKDVVAKERKVEGNVRDEQERVTGN
jgi:hypothetical protein